MKKYLLILLTSILIGCNSNEANENSGINGNPQNSARENNEAIDNNASASENDTSYNGYEPKDAIEQTYFDAIFDYSTWNSYHSNFTYIEELKGEDDIPLELYTTSRFVIKPYQLHQVYHSIYFRNDNIEVYATEHGAYENQQYTFWEKVKDYSVYIMNQIPARTDLYYALIAGSEGIVEDGPSKISFNIAEEKWEVLYEKVQLAYFHNLINKGTASSDGMEGLLEYPENMEGFYVEMTLENGKLSTVSITISCNRTDVETVDQLLFHEDYSEVNEFNTIEIPEEVLQEASKHSE